MIYLLIYLNYDTFSNDLKITHEGESNENFKSVIKIRNTARLSCKLTTILLMVLTVADRWQYDAGMKLDGAIVV